MRKVLSRLLPILILMSVIPADVGADLRSWILTKHDAVGFANLTNAAMDSIAAEYDWLDGYDGAQYSANGPDAQITYLHGKNPDLRICHYTDNSFSDWRAGYWFHIYADTFSVVEEDCYLHFKIDGLQAQSAVVDDKFGAANCYGSGAWFYGPAGQGVFAFDTSSTTWYEFTDDAYDGTNQEFCPDLDDCLYLGQYGRFKEANFTLHSVAAGSWAGTWEYYNGSGWTALSGVSDGTSNMTQNGKVEWTVPTEAAWPDFFPDDEVYINQWVRLRCTNTGTAPHLATVKGEDYIVDAGGGNYTIPGWDPANDANSDGVWDVNTVPAATATFRWHARVKGAWQSFKHRSNYYNKNSAAFNKLFKIYLFNYISETGADGYFGDDWPWANLWGPDIPATYSDIWALYQFADQEEADSAWEHWSVTVQAQAIRDTLVAANGSDTLVGGNTSELVSIPYFGNPGGAKGPMHYQSIEMYNKIASGGSLHSAAEEWLSIPIAGVAQGQAMCLTHYYSTSRWDSEKARWDNFTLASHYLIAGPRIYFGIMRTTSDARSLGWIKAIDFDIGQPTTPNDYIDTTNHSYYVWDATDHIYAREFENALVLVKFRASATIDSTTAKNYYLGGSYRRLYGDSTYSAFSDSVELLAGDGAILVPASGGDDVFKLDGLKLKGFKR
jgi:hypothetical protein